MSEFEGFWDRVNRENRERRAAAAAAVPGAVFLVSYGWGGYYVDASGVYIGISAEVPGRLDSNECIRACESATYTRLAEHGYVCVGMW